MCALERVRLGVYLSGRDEAEDCPRIFSRRFIVFLAAVYLSEVYLSQST